MALTTIDPALQNTQAQYTGFKNRIINGDMLVWQRGTSATGSGYQTADRWSADNSGTFAQSTDVPTGSQFKYSLSCSFSAGTYATMKQRIESNNSYDLVGQSITVSMWLKPTAGSTTYYMQIYGANAADNFNGGVTLIGNSSFTAPLNTWTYVTKTFTNLGATAANGVQLYFFASDNTPATTYLYTGVQLEKGSTATSFDYRPYGTELALCQRYFNIWNHATNFSPVGAGGWTGNSTQSYISIPFPVAMRSAPTLAFGGTVICLNLVGNDGTLTSINNQSSSTISGRFGTICSGATSISAGQATWLQPAAGLANYISASAEL